MLLKAPLARERSSIVVATQVAPDFASLYEAASELITRYAPIFVSKVLSLFAVDGVANPLKRKPQCSGLSFEIFPDSLFD